MDVNPCCTGEDNDDFGLNPSSYRQTDQEPCVIRQNIHHNSMVEKNSGSLNNQAIDMRRSKDGSGDFRKVREIENENTMNR